MSSSNQKQPNQGSSLEQTIEFLSESNGFVCHSKHYHSFRSVSFLLSLRSCAGCGDRLQPVLLGGIVNKNSTNQIVQCIACGALAHRSCGFSNGLEWKEVCPVNRRTVQEHSEPEEDTSIYMQQEHDGSSNAMRNLGEKQDEAVAGSDARDKQVTSSLTDKLSSFLLFRNSGKHEVPADNSVLPNNEELCGEVEAGRSDAEELEGSEVGQTSIDRSSIFRPPTQPLHIASIDHHSQPPFQSLKMPPLISKAMSENGILHGRRYDTYSKSNFPFLSAATLLPSYTEQQQRDPPLSTGDIGEIQRSQTWGGYEGSVDAAAASFVPPDVVERAFGPQANASAALIAEEGFRPTLEMEDPDIDSNENPSLEWTNNGPPRHWATEQSIGEMIAQRETVENWPGGNEDGEDPLHFSRHPFASVSRALQENILAHFRPVVDRYLGKQGEGNDDNTEVNETPTCLQSEAPRSLSKTNDFKKKETATSGGIEGLLEESKPKVDAATAQRRLGLATVAGGIAGGVAGLVFAGPVGGVIGAKAGQTAGILGIILEGSVTIGVVTSGIAAGRYTGQQLQDKIEENRILALGDGTHRRVLLVRPSVTTDPVWADIYQEVRRSHSSGLSFSLLNTEAKAVKRERYEREVDIIKTGEDEIPTADKVLLLVSRILNNKESLPGHVYRHLIAKMRVRAEERGSLESIFMQAKKASSEPLADQDESSHLDFQRARRQDAHAVIKYVTATLLEVRPGFAVSPTITELTATAVEGLVFGEVYDMVLEEIEMEHEDRDNQLLDKINAFLRLETLSEESRSLPTSSLSESALSVLHCLPQAHSAVDKLTYCVQFLEKISDFYSESSENLTKSASSMGADSLLKMVCQHILVAKVLAVNAQIAFLEEFARDEQLLRGKEGYALVTLQASLHFLNASDNFKRDIFEQEDEA